MLANNEMRAFTWDENRSGLMDKPKKFERRPVERHSRSADKCSDEAGARLGAAA